ncbi:1,4-dihydroxy-2-naphthoate octaprenyltransferase [Bacteroides helcogenes]|uniref:1,4-dihydroxy-2-naphthoate octaprenyltransferase n=1 Tax=Bacteroides helcogenes (strain ATCC 35417 / DSM 20613 / JCM 6297 / CCUG 15421 / P 36-108) TaxID=693979 RepID=E6SSD9_BACT6|nr:1,4-dihydroxy-2-naphthoate octaprenyltransferase [Bacteroides helcogenes]ADV45190.1 1,4-dihydroxy-2-naphtoate prenyltransferase [Bacteroides helcogenes P 36-108]MDY5238751.1 1,4-dihydroxy-2-naphthoate octaprenyltransferase [Bacteroides helcogenes]
METIKTDSIRAWILAARPKTLTGAVVPVLIGTSLTLADGQFKVMGALLCLLFACGMQIAANFINDLYDYLKGTDREDRLGPERACAQGWITPESMKRGIGVTVILACLTGCGLLYENWGKLPYGGWELILLGLLCVVFAFLYTTVLSYHGWGDLSVLIFFGFVPVGGTYYVQAYTITADVIIASVISGLIIDTLLVVNNYRDREQDAASGKRTLIVRFGEPFGRYMYLGLGIAATLLSLWFARDWNPTAILLPFFYLFAHVRTWQRMCRIYRGKKLNSILGETSRNMLLMGLLLSAVILIEFRTISNLP